jgi:hypothetical protein
LFLCEWIFKKRQHFHSQDEAAMRNVQTLDSRKTLAQRRRIAQQQGMRRHRSLNDDGQLDQMGFSGPPPHAIHPFIEAF